MFDYFALLVYLSDITLSINIYVRHYNKITYQKNVPINPIST